MIGKPESGAEIKGVGNRHDSQVTGNSAANWLNSGRSDDVIRGGGGSDILIGGAGADAMEGGRSSDVFQFYSGSETDGDRIVSFERGLDLIEDFQITTDALIRPGEADFVL